MPGIFMKTAALWFLLIIIPVTASAQSVGQLIKAGDKKFSEGDYYSALLYYKSAKKKDDENAGLHFKYAEAARMFHDYKEALNAYTKVLKSDKAGSYPIAAFHLGEVLKSLGRYEEAIRQYRYFRNKYRKQDDYLRKTQQELESCTWAKEHLQPVDSIKIIHLGTDINSGASEFNAVHIFPDKIQYSALRNISGDKKREKYLVRLYNQPPNFQTIFMPEGANEELHIGNGAYSPDSKRFYFTQCEPRDKSSTRCDIYVSTYEHFKWGKVEKLNHHVNDSTATNTHPAVGYDLSGNEVLFFASDREGGKGQMDIWICKRNEDGSYQNAVNAGSSINTPGNEVTPFYNVTNKKLYFSSDWHYGFGGFDIYESSGESVNWTLPVNLLQPVNTPQNDLYYSVALDQSRAYITSNRTGSYFIESETCCNDIYMYETGQKITPLEKTDTVKKEIVEGELISPEIITPISANESPTPQVRETDEIKRIQSKLPVVLYFHNDEPECCNLSDTTTLDYRETYQAYTALLGEYIREFSRSSAGGERKKSEEEIMNLFLQKVDKGYHDLVAITAAITESLLKDRKIELNIKGYCSPLNDNAYNIHLGNRRVVSIKNYLAHYRDGILQPYIANGSLFLKHESFGEETAPKGISDNRMDKRNSVYHPDAALERRVEITAVELK